MEGKWARQIEINQKPASLKDWDHRGAQRSQPAFQPQCWDLQNSLLPKSPTLSQEEQILVYLLNRQMTKAIMKQIVKSILILPKYFLTHFGVLCPELGSRVSHLTHSVTTSRLPKLLPFATKKSQACISVILEHTLWIWGHLPCRYTTNCNPRRLKEISALQFIE